jgi:hypothetical protein
MRTLQLNNDIYHLPGTWNELTAEQLLYLINQVNRRASAEEIKLKLLLFCLPAHVRKYRVTDGSHHFTVISGKRKYHFSAQEIGIICNIFDFLFVEENGNISINPMLTRNPFPTVQCDSLTVHGPGDGLQDITYEQFVFLLTYHQQMQTDPNAIHSLLSIIYRPNTGEILPEEMKKMHLAVKTAILWFFLGCIQFISEKFPMTFSGGGTPSGNIFESQMRVIDALASNDVTKKEAVKNSLLYDALYSLEIAAENAERLKRR